LAQEQVKCSNCDHTSAKRSMRLTPIGKPAAAIR
jgi:hypothetical protein